MADVIITYSPRSGTSLDGAAASPKAETIARVMEEHGWSFNEWTLQWRLPAALEATYPLAAATTAATDLAQAGVTVDIDLAGHLTHLNHVRPGPACPYDVTAGDWVTLTRLRDVPGAEAHLLVEAGNIARPWLKVTAVTPGAVELLDLAGHPMTAPFKNVHDVYRVSPDNAPDLYAVR